MTEQATEYRVTYTKANLDALRAEDKAAIERLSADVARTAIQRNRAEADAKELREERERSRQSMEKMQAELGKLKTENIRQRKDSLLWTDKVNAENAVSQAKIEHLEAVAKMKDKRLELIGSVIDKDVLERSALHDAIDEILMCQKLPPQCQHCGGLTDPDDAGMCHLCNFAYAKEDAQAHKDQMAGV